MNMEKAAHTPGPWKIEKNGLSGYGDNGKTFFIVDADDEEIAALPTAFRLLDTNDGESARYRSEEANARLIAAAPDMLAALEAIRDWLLDTEIVKTKDERYWRSDFVKANNLALAAIAKATGADTPQATD